MSAFCGDMACPGCGGTGIGGYVSWEMASDAGEPSMEGQPIPCCCVKTVSPSPSMPGAEDAF